MKFSFARFSGFLEYFLITRRKLFSLSIAKLPFTSGRLESKGTPPWKPRNYWLLSALNKTEKGKNHINKNVPPTTQTRNNATFNTLQLSSLSEWDLFPLQGAVSLFLHPKRITLQHFMSCIHFSESTHPICKPAYQFFLLFIQLPFPSPEKFILFLGTTSEKSQRNHHIILKAVAFHNIQIILQKSTYFKNNE